MPSRAECKTVFIPPECHAEAWPLASKWLRYGAVRCQETTLEMVAKLARGEADLWIVVEGETVSAAFLTEEHNDALTIFGMGGNGALRWAREGFEVVADFARARGFNALRFAGKRGWGRLLPSVQEADETLRGEVIFERTLQ